MDRASYERLLAEQAQERQALAQRQEESREERVARDVALALKAMDGPRPPGVPAPVKDVAEVTKRMQDKYTRIDARQMSELDETHAKARVPDLNVQQQRSDQALDRAEATPEATSYSAGRAPSAQPASRPQRLLTEEQAQEKQQVLARLEHSQDERRRQRDVSRAFNERSR